MTSFRRVVSGWVIRSQIRYRERPLAWYVGQLEAGAPYGFARYGDGEWNAMFGASGTNSDGHAFFPGLGAALREAVLHPGPYAYGIRVSLPLEEGWRVAQFVRAHRVTIPWCDASVFHRANEAGRLLPLVQALRRRPVVIVGPPFLRDVDRRLFTPAGFIEVPVRDCWLAYEQILAAVRAHAAGAPAGVVYAFSAGMTANVLVHALHAELGAAHWLIDFGSLWDGYAGVLSRGYVERVGAEEIVRRNLGA